MILLKSGKKREAATRADKPENYSGETRIVTTITLPDWMPLH